jgi:hypothetical protein
LQAELEAAFEAQMTTGRRHAKAGQLDAAFACFERAHVLGQWHTMAHWRSHLGLLHVGWRRGDAREVVGQVFRLIATLLATPIGWVPPGNTGGARINPWQSMPIDSEARRLLRADPRSARGLERRR